jgi:hypothetical protein
LFAELELLLDAAVFAFVVIAALEVLGDLGPLRPMLDETVDAHIGRRQQQLAQ